MSTAANPIVDAGASFEHGEQPAQGTPTPQKTDLEKRFEALESDLKSERALRKEAEETSKFWAGRASQPTVVEEHESDDEPIQDDPIVEDAQVLLDDIAKEGYAALKKRGFVREADVRKLVREAEQRAAERIDQRDTQNSFERQLASEFPELVEDSKRIASGKAPESDLWKRSQEIYREAVALDPTLKKSSSALIIAARQARAEISAKAKGKGTVRDDDDDDVEVIPSRGAQRRARIQSQAAEPRRATGADDEGSPALSNEARTVMKHMGITEAEYMKFTGGQRGR